MARKSTESFYENEHEHEYNEGPGLVHIDCKSSYAIWYDVIVTDLTKKLIIIVSLGTCHHRQSGQSTGTVYESLQEEIETKTSN